MLRKISRTSNRGRYAQLDGSTKRFTHPALEAIKVKCAIQGPHELAGQGLAALLTYAHLAAGRAAIPWLRSISLPTAAAVVSGMVTAPDRARAGT